MLCIVAEKFIMARSIGRALMAGGGLQSPSGISGLINGKPAIIVWADGHLLELAEPEDYNPKWKSWCLEDLPIFPEFFRFLRCPKDSGKLQVVKAALDRATVIVNACDAAREGELIFDEIAEYCGVYARKAQILRMWISDTTSTGIRTAFGLLKSHTDKELVRLRKQARVRQECDQLWGFNLTRYATLALRDKMTLRTNFISVGRVRSPTVALIADRCRANEFHVAKPYWLGLVRFKNEKGEICEAKLIAPPEFKYGHRDTDWGDHIALSERVTFCRTMIAEEWDVVEGESKKAKEFAPSLFDLTELQRAANRLWRWSAKKTERTAQILYERYGAISYPRTDCEKLPQSMEGEVSKLWEDLYTKWLPDRFPDEMEKMPEFEPENNFNYAEKISDHFAIIPTSTTPPPSTDNFGNMTDEYALWELITLRFITAFLPPATVDASSRVFTKEYAPGEFLRALVMAAPVIDSGWLKFEDVIGSTRGFGRKLSDRLKDKVLPNMGTKSKLNYVWTERRKTTPPEIYTYDMLLHAMVENGLGTPATRGEQIETAIALNYIYEDNFGRLRSTDDGEQVVSYLRAHGGEQILDPKLTAFWEKMIELVGKGGEKGREREDILDDLVLQIEDLGLKMTAPGQVRDIVFCPKTGKLVEENDDFWRFAGWPDVKCPHVIMKRPMNANEYRDIFASGSKGAGPYKGFINKNGVEFACHLVLAKCKTRFEPKFKRR